MTELQTIHKLAFEVADWHDPSYKRFRVGTCRGLYTVDNGCYCIIAIENDKQGNGHLNDVFEWFENSCKRDGLHLRVCAVWNKKFKKHLLKKRGFVQAADDQDDVIKMFKYMRHE